MNHLNSTHTALHAVHGQMQFAQLYRGIQQYCITTVILISLKRFILYGYKQLHYCELVQAVTSQILHDIYPCMYASQPLPY